MFTGIQDAYTLYLYYASPQEERARGAESGAPGDGEEEERVKELLLQNRPRLDKLLTSKTDEKNQLGAE
ncbi:hypothetical protein VZT92_002213 [Zoarces viviparus]|uniref:Uncharacterized protein n=1 Tax=Zoarces viviparus TaxID=48416 RepID=A0AAW1G044_ZOAVI